MRRILSQGGIAIAFVLGRNTVAHSRPWSDWAPVYPPDRQTSPTAPNCATGNTP
ncbi:hypothetical protein [Mycobacteroides abscessus]|uniref:hypothetical protein n=1 Tax=Mycobacteroides abscessus TaxID=36809 RepID=UPI0013F63D5F|nr:hypothetical protein [Mycobacteroides abscessus]MBN7332943.1 hypothetical protein [Mycobacteroides abscessus subsp. abscessus]